MIPAKSTQISPTPTPAHPPALADNLARHAKAAAGAFSPHTERAITADTAKFVAYCADIFATPLPASESTLAGFIDEMAASKAPASVRRYVSSIAHMHRAAGVDDPSKSEIVKLALRRMHRDKGRRQTQAAGITLDVRNRMIDASGDHLGGLRDRALLAVAYDSLLRRAELVALRVGDLAFAEDGTGTVLVQRSKTDTEGEGSVVFLAPDSVVLVRAWLGATGESEGPLFRSVRKGGRLGGPLDAGDVSRIFKKMAKAAGLDVEGISGHSARVGGAQDMAFHGIEITNIMQSGRWKTPAMVGRYCEKLAVRRGGAAKLATLQNRL